MRRRLSPGIAFLTATILPPFGAVAYFHLVHALVRSEWLIVGLDFVALFGLPLLGAVAIAFCDTPATVSRIAMAAGYYLLMVPVIAGILLGLGLEYLGPL